MESGPDTTLYSPDGQFFWDGSEWVPKPDSVPESPETTQEYNQELDVPIANEKFSKLPVIVITVLILTGIFFSSGGDKFELEFFDSEGFLYITEFEADNGEPDRMIELTVYYDERNRGTVNTGEDCTALIYYDMPRTYYVEELCFLYLNTDPYTEQATFTFCAEYVASGQDYDLYSEASSSIGCVWYTNVFLFPPYLLDPEDEPTADQCSEDGELIESGMTGGALKEASGLEDGDSNAYNGRLEAMLTFTITYQCKLV